MITVTALGLMAALAQAAPCESLRTASLPNTTITSAQLVAAGPYVAPAPGGPPGGPVVPAAGRGEGAGSGGGRGGAEAPAGPVLQAHCRIADKLKAIYGTVIVVEVLL